jgi:undecaprenyl-diphosphatase
MFNWLIDLDREFFLFLNGLHSGYWDTIMLMITRKEFWLPLYILVLYFIFRTSGRRSYLIVLFLLISVLVSDQITGFLKDAVERLRPVYQPDIMDMVHNVLRKGGLYGFPSSHASNSFALFTFTSLFFRNRIYSAILLTWALLISYSRVYTGVHYPLDILAGVSIGILTGYLFFKLYLYFCRHLTGFSLPQMSTLTRSQATIAVLIFIVHLGSLFLTAWILHKYNYL